MLAEEDYAIIRRAFDLAEETGGLFDPTVGALTSVWRRRSNRRPDQLGTDLHRMAGSPLSDEEMSAGIGRPGITVDMGAVVPGMAVEAALEAYQSSEIDGGLITMDGAAAMTGVKGQDGEPFTLGLLNPMTDTGEHYAVLQADDTVICTSDSNSGLLDPTTGYPVETDLSAVTVLSEDGFLSDAMSSILYMQGLEQAITHLEEADYQVIIVAENGDIYLSPSLRDKFTLRDTENFQLVD